MIFYPLIKSLKKYVKIVKEGKVHFPYYMNESSMCPIDKKIFIDLDKRLLRQNEIEEILVFSSFPLLFVSMLLFVLETKLWSGICIGFIVGVFAISLIKDREDETNQEIKNLKRKYEEKFKSSQHTNE
jgi:hypothetical protein